MSKTEKIYYAYKNKSEIYYLTAEEENKLMALKCEFLKTLSSEQIKKFLKLEIGYNSYKEALTKEIINYSISFNE